MPTPLQFASPAEVVALYDNDIHNGKASLHPWQFNLLEELGTVKPTSKNPYRLYLVAANGSGKDKYIIAPFCLWFILSKANAEVIVTSSSAQQLDNQTEKYIRFLANNINSKHECELVRVVKRKVECGLTNSTIRLFATDEPGKAEGYHPLTTDSEMAIVTNETKSIPDEIMEALMRCSGFNYWIEVSSPGQPSGHFYRSVTQGKGKSIRITSYDCPHISKEEIEYDKQRLGESSVLFRSKHLALFTSLEQQVVLRREIIDKYIANPPQEHRTGVKRAGLDFGAGGDETVLSVWDGNCMIGLETLTCEDTEKTCDWVVSQLKNYDLSPGQVWADDGGIGRNFYFSLKARGFQLNRVLFNSPAINKKEFVNFGAELWWKFSRYYQMGALRILPDNKLVDQLSNRFYDLVVGGRIKLAKKSELRSQGYPSPDRADATILSCIPVTLDMAESWICGRLPKRSQQKSAGTNLSISTALKYGSRPKQIYDWANDPRTVVPQETKLDIKNPANLIVYLYGDSYY